MKAGNEKGTFYCNPDGQYAQVKQESLDVMDRPSPESNDVYLEPRFFIWNKAIKVFSSHQ